MAGSVDDQVSVAQQGVRNLGLIYQVLLTIAQKFPNWVTVPATASSPGTPGQVAYDSSHFYLCVAPSTWVRTTLSTF